MIEERCYCEVGLSSLSKLGQVQLHDRFVAAEAHDPSLQSLPKGPIVQPTKEIQRYTYRLIADWENAAWKKERLRNATCLVIVSLVDLKDSDSADY